MDNKKICKRCGALFTPRPYQQLCDECKQKTLSDQRRKDIQRIKAKQIQQTCSICGKTFFAYKVKKTCGPDCEAQLRSVSHVGKTEDANTRKKIGDKNCTKWHIISPDGKHYEFDNLQDWARNNCELFGVPESDKNAKRIAAGISHAKGTMMGTNSSPVTTYKGWRVVVEYGPYEICKLYREGANINSIHNISGLSTSKIRKVLISRNLWGNEMSEKIKFYQDLGKSADEIADLLGISGKTVNLYMPYSKGVYGYKQSDNALAIKRHRGKKYRDNSIDNH